MTEKYSIKNEDYETESHSEKQLNKFIENRMNKIFICETCYKEFYNTKEASEHSKENVDDCSLHYTFKLKGTGLILCFV